VEAGEDRVVRPRDVDQRGAQRHDALLGEAKPVPLEEGHRLRRPGPLRLEAQQERARGGGQLDRRADERVDGFDVGRIRRRSARHEPEPAIGPGLEHQHLQDADDAVVAHRHDSRRRRAQVGLQLAPLPGLEDVAVRRRFDEGVPGLAVRPRGESQRVAHRSRHARL
jgi:hypothetical protein